MRCLGRGDNIIPRPKAVSNKYNPTLYKARAPKKGTYRSATTQAKASIRNLKLCVELLAQSRSVILLKSFSKGYVVWNTVVMTLPVWQWSMQKGT
ncbi:Uncharacterised protein [Leclercia adecarboxylata]|uniref:Uncharacterized protein n=1 Tax=Leclercia adecarboxylata TaxID=83655 RepID=A0A4V6YYE6_9ENTR|nr:Uncharacterised protein [Leclercia adecarboxylata]